MDGKMIKDDYHREEVVFVDKFLERLEEIGKPASRNDLVYDGSGRNNYVNSKDYDCYYHIISTDFIFIEQVNGLYSITEEGKRVILKGGFRKYLTYLKREQRKEIFMQTATDLLGKEMIIRTDTIPRVDKTFIFQKILSNKYGLLKADNGADKKVLLQTIVQQISSNTPLVEPIEKLQPVMKAIKTQKLYTNNNNKS
jgi:hypothetical protein